MFSKSCEYGIRASLYILAQSLDNRKVKVGEVAQNIDSPTAFTAKILGLLTKHNIVSSQTGPNGGFYIDALRLKDIKLEEIVVAIDGNSLYEGCGIGLKLCDDHNPCPLHNEFVKIKAELKSMLRTTSIHDLAIKLKSGESVLVR